jgi:carboxylesterase
MGLKAFEGAEHLPFRIEGDGSLALLLIHGFPGTPAEMRPLADLTAQLGITIEAPLLPGFGREIATLATRTRHDWIDTVQSSLASLRSRHRQVILAGFSMGGALAIHAATGNRMADHLLLLAPFWQLGERWHQPLWPLVRLLLREFKPFARVDLDDPVVQRDLRRSMPEADLNDPEIRESIRLISFPISVIDQVRSLGRETWRLAPHLSIPITVIQGSLDTIVPPSNTRRLVSRLGGNVSYLEIEADHQLIDPQKPAWAGLAKSLEELLRRHLALIDLEISLPTPK